MLGIGLGLGIGIIGAEDGAPPAPYYAKYKALMNEDLVATSPTGTPGTGSCVRALVANYTRISDGLIVEAAINTARFQTNPNTNRPALLVETESTNLAPYSKFMTTAAGQWSSYWDADTADIVAPNGVAEAPNCHQQYGFGSYSLANSLVQPVAGEYRTVSVYIKKLSADSAPFARIQYKHRDGTFTRQYFNMTTNVPGALHSGDVAPLHTYMEAAGNDWYRIGMTLVEAGGTATANGTVLIQTSNEAGGTFPTVAGEGTSYWGFQIEENVYMSSLIYTEATAVTRPADRIDMPPVDAFIDRTLGAYSCIIHPLANSRDRVVYPNATQLILASNTATYMMKSTDGGTYPDSNYQWSAGNSYVSGQYPGDTGDDERWCMTYNASGTEAFPGTKRYMWIDSTKRPRVNNTLADDLFTEFPATTVLYIGYDGNVGSGFATPFPMLISDIKFWPELTDAQALAVSQTG